MTHSLLHRLSLASLFALGLPIQPVQAAIQNCNVSLSESTLDYGEFTFYGLLNNENGKSFGTQQVQLQVNCLQPENIALQLQGIKAANVNSVVTSNGGFINVMISKVILDDKTVNFNVTKALDQQPNAWQSSTIDWPPGQILMAENTNSGTKSRHLSALLTLSLNVDTVALKRHSEQTLDASMSFTLAE